jgi:hypothetical protein
VAQAGVAQVVVVVEPLVLHTGADAEVGGEPTAADDDGADAAEWGGGDTRSGTSEEHYRMELPRPSSSWSPCGHGSHRP